MNGELEGLGLSPELKARAEELGQLSAERQAARDENLAVVRANDLGLSGRDAEIFKERYVSGLQAGRQKVRDHVQAVLESPAGRSRPSAALNVAMRSDLTAEQAIAKLDAMPPEEDEAATIARKILEA